MPKPQQILVFRFSALGDIAMTVPVIKLLLAQHPEANIIFVSTGFIKPFFSQLERLHFYTIETKGKHKGIRGLYRLYRELKHQFSIDAVADLHNVLRTQILRIFFKTLQKPIAFIDKGRAEKAMLTRPQNKVLKPLKSGFQRYADVFAALGLPITLNVQQGVTYLPKPQPTLAQQNTKQNVFVGIAPFAQYAEKIYPLAKMQQVIQLLLKHSNIKVFLFGSPQEASMLQQFAEGEKTQVQIVAGTMNFAQEMELISQLTLMVSMDSANMHIASLLGVPVVSIWGGTHPFLGFYGWGQPLDNAVQIDLDCRPSSVFGNKPCPRGDYACMNLIAPLMVYDKIMRAAGL